MLPPVNVGFTAETVRAELVLLATLLDADVPQGSDSYIVNANGTVTSDFIQVREFLVVLRPVRLTNTCPDGPLSLASCAGPRDPRVQRRVPDHENHGIRQWPTC